MNHRHVLDVLSDELRTVRTTRPGLEAGHLLALILPKDCERGILGALRGLADYADGYHAEFPPTGPVNVPQDSFGLGSDYVLGNAWIAAVSAVVDLLNGPTGRLDCGTVDRAARAMVRAAGFTNAEADRLERTGR